MITLQKYPYLAFSIPRVYNTNMQISELSELFSALSNEKRLLVFLIIMKLEPVCVCDIIKITELPQSSVSRALSYLRLSGLVISNRDGTRVCYSIDRTNPVVPPLLDFLKNLNIPELKDINNFEKSC